MSYNLTTTTEPADTDRMNARAQQEVTKFDVLFNLKTPRDEMWSPITLQGTVQD